MGKNLIQIPISQFKQKNTPFLLHKSTKWTKISIPSYKKIVNPVYFFPEPPWSKWPGQPESARFRPNGPFRFWSSIYDPN